MALDEAHCNKNYSKFDNLCRFVCFGAVKREKEYGFRGKIKIEASLLGVV